MKRTLIVDADIPLFQVCRVTEDLSQFGDTVCESYDHEAAIRLFDQALANISKKTGYKPEEIVCAISDKANFRKRFFPTYKGNRKKVRKPLGLKDMRQHLLDNTEQYQTIMMEELEADDVMGIYGTAPVKMIEQEIAIHSEDKDLFTIPVKQWDFKLKKFIVPTMLESITFLYTQVCTGDVTDGYFGCPKIGKVKAARIVSGCKSELELLENTHKTYFNHYGESAKEELLKQIGQARILHYMDSQLLTEHGLTHDPYMLLNVHPDTIEKWEEGCEEFVNTVIRKRK